MSIFALLQVYLKEEFDIWKKFFGYLKINPESNATTIYIYFQKLQLQIDHD